MTDGEPDPLNEKAKPPGRWMPQAILVVVVITAGIVSGAKIWQPVKKVEQKVTAPIRNAVKRSSPIGDLPDAVDGACASIVSLHWDKAPAAAPQGIILSPDGTVATTAVIPADAAIEAWLDSGQKLKGTVAGSDPISGITLVKLDGSDLQTATLDDGDLPRIGTWGFTLRSPLGSGCIVDTGIVASDFQTEGSPDYYVRIHAGNAAPVAGMPFLTADGRIVGLARPIEGKGKGKAAAATADPDRYVPIDLVTTVVSFLMRGSAAPLGSFGLIAEDLSPDLADRIGADRGRGAVIVQVQKGSIADKAGLRVGDVILSAGQSPVSSSSELNRSLRPDKPIDLVIQRGGSDQTTRTITLASAAR